VVKISTDDGRKRQIKNIRGDPITVLDDHGITEGGRFAIQFIGLLFALLSINLAK